MKKFAFLFTLGNKIVWSGDTPTQLLNRVSEEADLVIKVAEFINVAHAGHHMELPTGEFIFCTKG